MFQLAALRRYLIENRMPHLLQVRIQRNAQKFLANESQSTREDQVELLRFVSRPLMMELHFELYHRSFSDHPFVSRYLICSVHEGTSLAMQRICDEAVKIHVFAEADLIFSAGEKPLVPSMYFVCGGDVRYGDESWSAQDVPVGQWLSEPTLWTEWIHRGTCLAQSSSRLALIDSARFGTIVRADQVMLVDTVQYATAFIQEMNQHATTVSDMPLHVTMWSSEATVDQSITCSSWSPVTLVLGVPRLT
jgi:hypothetical protein